MIDPQTPVPLTPALANLCSLLRIAARTQTTLLELEAFQQTLTWHDAQRLENTLRHVEGKPKWADALRRHVRLPEPQP